MWVYWITLGSLSIILYFPYKKLFSKELALRASVATFIVGLFYPLLQARLSFWQTFVCLGLLLLFLGVTISRKHPQWDKDGSSDAELSSPEDHTFTELKQDKIVDRDEITFLPESDPIFAVQGQQDDKPEIEYIPSIEDILIESKKELPMDIAENTEFNLLSQQEPSPEIYPDAKKVGAQPENNEQDEVCENIDQSQDVIVEEVDSNESYLEDKQELLLQIKSGDKSFDASPINDDQSDLCNDLNQSIQEVISENYSCENLNQETQDTEDFLPESNEEVNPDNINISLAFEQSEDNSKETNLLQEQLSDQNNSQLDPSITCDFSEQPSESYEVDTEPSQNQNKISYNTQQLLAEALRLAKSKNYAQAVRYFNQVISSNPEQDILYLTVSELSSLYQHLGLYQMASDIIKTFIEHPNLTNHPGLKHLIQKMKFIEYLTYLLKRDNYGQIPYDEVPESVRREAFDNSLNIKRLIS